jgi:predicted O-methyltransferase YrrM
VGFLSRDEAMILYNTALAMRGKPALEIGCWLGWSACHLARGGVTLDVIDPLLKQPEFKASVCDSLRAASVLASVNLVAGKSPDAVEQLAATGRRWALLFIDGDHDGTAPVHDAEVCARFAEDDALILFHDLASPDVAAGLRYLRHRGWKTLVYQTMQIMGVAWRGSVRPVDHVPDPAVAWELPRHLEDFPLCGARRETPCASKQ